MSRPDGSNSPGTRGLNSSWIGAANAADNIESRLAALRDKGHTIVTTVDHTGARTLTVDGRTYGGPTLADCLIAAGLA